MSTATDRTYTRTTVRLHARDGIPAVTLELPLTCRAARADGAGHRCGRQLAGFTVIVNSADVTCLLDGEEACQLYPLGYCAEHLRQLAEPSAAHRDIHGLGAAVGVVGIVP